MPERVPQQIAVAFALSAFVVAIGAGLLSSLPPFATLVRSVVALILSYPIGRALGAVLGVALNEHLTAMVKASPVPAPIRPESGVRSNGLDGVGGLGDVESM